MARPEEPADAGTLLLRADANVTETMFEHQLDLVRAASVSSVAGVFGPGSAMWHINRQALLFVAAGRALLLQLAHPWVASAVAKHSQALADPIGRFHRTFGIVFAMVFGTLDQAIAAARRLHRRDAEVVGELPTEIGPFKKGSPYRADNISALLWVYATLIDSAIAAYNLVLTPLTAAERERYYAESMLLAALFGIPGVSLPPTHRDFLAYTEAMKRSKILTVSAEGRSITNQLFAGFGAWIQVSASYTALSFEMLPERLREEFGFGYGAAERRAAERAVKLIRGV